MIQQTLRNLPVGLIETYERILLKISKSPLAKQDIALRVFNWIFCARRPMKADELQEAVAFEISDKFWERDKIPDENLMIETCRGLLIRDEVDRTVRFAHHTVQQYLLSAPVIRTQEGARFPISPRSEAEAFVGKVCVTYLCFSDFETQITRRTPNVHPEDLGVLRTGGPVGIPTVLGIGKSLLQIPYRLLGGTSTTTPLKIDYSKYLAPDTRTRPQAPSDLPTKYRLLEYIVEYWMDHTKDLEPALDSKLRHLQQSFRLINPHLKTQKNALSHQNTYNTLLIMGRIKGIKDLGGPKKGALIALSELDNVSNRQVARANNCDEKTVRNARKRASEAEKENLDPLSTEAHQRRPQSGRPLTINDRLLRQLIRHATKNEFQRRKPWVTIAREIGCMAAASTVNAAFKRAGYGRYPPRYKPPLTPK